MWWLTNDSYSVWHDSSDFAPNRSQRFWHQEMNYWIEFVSSVTLSGIQGQRNLFFVFLVWLWLFCFVISTNLGFVTDFICYCECVLKCVLQYWKKCIKTIVLSSKLSMCIIVLLHTIPFFDMPKTYLETSFFQTSLIFWFRLDQMIHARGFYLTWTSVINMSSSLLATLNSVCPKTNC